MKSKIKIMHISKVLTYACLILINLYSGWIDENHLKDLVKQIVRKEDNFVWAQYMGLDDQFIKKQQGKLLSPFVKCLALLMVGIVKLC